MKKSLSAAALTVALLAGLTGCGDDDNLNPEDRSKATEAALSATGGGYVTDVNREDDDEEGYAYEVEVTFQNGSDVTVQLDKEFSVLNSPPRADSFGNTSGSGETGSDQPTQTAPTFDDPDDRPLTGEALKKASAAALKATGGGKVIQTSGSDDGDHAYEVEVLFPSGEDVRVELDRDFRVVDIDG